MSFQAFGGWGAFLPIKLLPTAHLDCLMGAEMPDHQTIKFYHLKLNGKLGYTTRLGKTHVDFLCRQLCQNVKMPSSQAVLARPESFHSKPSHPFGIGLSHKILEATNQTWIPKTCGPSFKQHLDFLGVSQGIFGGRNLSRCMARDARLQAIVLFQS